MRHPQTNDLYSGEFIRFNDITRVSYYDKLEFSRDARIFQVLIISLFVFLFNLTDSVFSVF